MSYFIDYIYVVNFVENFWKTKYCSPGYIVVCFEKKLADDGVLSGVAVLKDKDFWTKLLANYNHDQNISNKL